ncbi:hypothetical protein GCM10023200_53990 [Actinomycetospora chlora]|uniref:Right-handed parallel beta-helix repeat-containing protein n=1 Tax=Actinomycetospora chlora TaxID=663608 RepID=A0ABP9CIA0_9PSEU
MLGAGVYQLSGPLRVGPAQDLLGAGGNLAGAATTLRCTAPEAGVVVTDSAGISGNLLIDGAGVAQAPFVRAFGGGAAQRTFLNLSVVGSAADNVLVAGAQNDTWIGCNAQEAARDNLVLDQGAGGHAFVRCEFNAAGRYGLRCDREIAGGPYAVPTDNTFDHCLFERESSSGTGVSQAFLPAVDALTFTACSFYATAASTGPRLDVPGGSGTVTIVGGRIQGSSPADGGTGLRVGDASRVVLAAQPRFEALAAGIELVAGNPTVHVLGAVFWNGVGTRYTGAGRPDTSVLTPTDHPVQITRDLPGDRALTVARGGEPGMRLTLGADGSLGWGDGSDYVPRTRLFAGAPGVLSMPPEQALQSGRGPTPARPDARVAGPGATFYDTTLRRPVWSDGAVWTDASGAPV